MTEPPDHQQNIPDKDLQKHSLVVARQRKTQMLQCGSKNASR